MNPEEQLIQLGQAPILKLLPQEELKSLFAEGHTRLFASGESVFLEGEEGDFMYVILSGEIEIYKENKQISQRGPTDFTGEMAMIERKPRAAGVRALQDTYLFQIDRPQFDRYLGSKPEVLKEFLRTISSRLRSDLDTIDVGYYELARSEERYRTIVETMSDLVIQLDEAGRIVFVNSAISFMGYDPGELIGTPIRDLVSEKEDPRRLADITTMRVGPRATYNVEMRLKVKEDSPFSELYEDCVFLLDAHGLWNVRKEKVLKKGLYKRHVGTLIIGRDITQRKQMEEDLERSRDELGVLVEKRTEHLGQALERTEKAQEAVAILISRLSHEIRTPLNAVMGYAHLLESADEKPTEDQLHSIEKIIESGKQLTLLVEQMLKVAEVESGHHTGFPRRINLAEGIRDLVRARSNEMEKKNIRLQMELAPELDAEFWIDQVHLRRILDQLMANAIRFNHEGGNLRVAGRLHEKQLLECVVEDSGQGMSEEELARMFLPVEVEHPDFKRQGFGLGLPLIKRLLESLGGTIQATSQPGQGTRITFTFPLQTQPPKKN